MRVTAENSVDAGDATTELEIDVHAVVRQENDDLRLLAAHFVDDLLQLLLANAETPIRDEAARMCDRRVGKCLPDDRDGGAVDLAQP